MDPNSPQDGSPGSSTQQPLWRRILPALVAAVLVAYVATRIDFKAFVRAVQRTNHIAFVGLAVGFAVSVLAADTLATTRVYRRILGPVRYRELFTVRGASYLPSMLNHHVGQAWLTYFMSRAYRAPLARAAGATLVVYATTFGALFAFLLAGLPLNHGRIAWLAPTVVVVLIAAALFAVALVAKPAALARRPLLSPLFEVGLGGHVTEILWRLPHVLVQFLGTWLPFLLFGIEVPLSDALALMPVILFVVALPISPQGLGARDALSIALLSNYAEGTSAERASTIAATTLSWLVAQASLQLLISLVFMKRAHRLLARDVAPAA